MTDVAYHSFWKLFKCFWSFEMDFASSTCFGK